MIPQAFVWEWNLAKSLDAFLAKTGLKKRPAVIRASFYRTLGIPLKTFSEHKPHKTLDVAKLSEIALRALTKSGGVVDL